MLPAQDVGYVKDRHPEVTQILGDFRIPALRYPSVGIMAVAHHPWI